MAPILLLSILYESSSITEYLCKNHLLQADHKHLMANQAINDLLADIHLMQGADMRHQHSINTKTGQPGTNKAISWSGKNIEYKQKSNALSHSGLTHAVFFGVSRLILGTI